MNIVAHNLSAMNAQRQFGINTKSKAKSTEKLSSGYKVNRAADDAAGLAISEKMRRQIRGLSQGVKNTEDGVSLCQVADGALAEVSDMLHRITELSIKSANGTNTNIDREYIQEEVQHLLTEINRIGDTTTFNEQPIFKGTDTIITNADGSPATAGNISFSDFTLADVSLGKTPITAGSSADTLRLQAIVDNENSAFNGRSFNLIFGNGSTSNSSFRITDTSGNQTIVKMDSLTATNFSTNGTDSWTREFNYSADAGVNLLIRQTVEAKELSANEKTYSISYVFEPDYGVADVEFMFHVDTAYNNNDRCEGYFVDGNRVNNYCVYSLPGSKLTDGASSPYAYDPANVLMPDSFSIVDVDNALAFSEKISFVGAKPDSFSIGHYSSIDNWSYYDNLDNNLGTSTNHADLGFSLYYDMDFPLGNTISFDYGIVSTESDTNLDGITIKKDNRTATDHKNEYSVWIHSGVESGDGIYVTIGEMNTDVLGLRGLDVSTVEGAEDAMDVMSNALHTVSSIRSTIGAQQNRLEHIIANENNIVENTTAAESQIRDTNMAQEMVRFSNLNILEQAGYAMMAQANQSNQGVLSLLQ